MVKHDGGHVLMFFQPHDPSSQPGAPPPMLLASQHQRPSLDLSPRKHEASHAAHGSYHPQLAPYVTQISPSHNLPHHLPPHLGNAQGPAGHNHTDSLTYYATHQSPYSTTSASSTYSSAETPELMAAPMGSQMPPRYHNPQSNSTAPPQHPHGRAMYGQPLPSGTYYYQYQYPHGSNYMHRPPGPAPRQPLAAHPPLSIPYQQLHSLQQQQSPHPQTPSMDTSPRSKSSQTPLQRPDSRMGPPPPIPAGTVLHSPHPSASAAAQSAAPGPIPATTPLVVKQDDNGVQWITFEYTRERMKVEYTIRGDVESVDLKTLSKEHKEENCVYPRACNTVEPYRGNRLRYETDCNEVGWALAWLNPELRGKRGLIQRAVDSWRNSNSNQKLRSRRVRRLTKTTKRNQNHLNNQGGSAANGASAGGLTGHGHSQPGVQSGGPQIHHHHMHPDSTRQRGDSEGSASHLSLHHNPSDSKNTSPVEVRMAQNFYPVHPVRQNTDSTMPPTHHRIDRYPPQSSFNAPVIATSVPKLEEVVGESILYSDLPNTKPRKLITIKDHEKDANVRVNAQVDGINLNEIPDDFRKRNSVYPRSYFPRRLQSPSTAGAFDGDEDGDDDSPNSILPRGQTTVKVRLMDGCEGQFDVPRMSKAKRRNEFALNDLGCQLTWNQTQQFSDRPQFLQRSLDALRQHKRKEMKKSGLSVAAYLETRPGKRKWVAATTTKPRHDDDQ